MHQSAIIQDSGASTLFDELAKLENLEELNINIERNAITDVSITKLIKIIKCMHQLLKIDINIRCVLGMGVNNF